MEIFDIPSSPISAGVRVTATMCPSGARSSAKNVRRLAHSAMISIFAISTSVPNLDSTMNELPGTRNEKRVLDSRHATWSANH